MTDFNIVGTLGAPVDPIGERMLHGVGHDLREVVESGVGANSLRITDDAGNGEVSDDLNNTDFTSQVGETFAYLEKQVVYTFIHKAVLYSWVGIKDRNVGVGGNLIALPPDLLAQGTADHNLLFNRNAPSAHEPEDITGLNSKQASQDAATAQVASDLATHKVAIPAHGTENIAGLDADQAAQDQALADHKVGADEHPMSSITGLVAEQNAQDAALQAHLDDTTQGAHDQFATKQAVLDNFVAAGYGGLHADAQQGMPNLDSSWELYTAWDAAAIVSPRYITQDVANNGIRFDAVGVWMVNLKISISHNENNGGRTVKLRLYDATDDVAGVSEFVFGVGRNTDATNLVIPGILWETPSDKVGNLIQVEIGGGSSFNSVLSLGGFMNATNVGEFRGEL